MSGPSIIDPDALPAIDCELSRSGLIRLSFEDPALEACYNSQRRAETRFHNRIVVSLVISLVDLYIFAEVWLTPEILKLSALFRFAVLTPLTLLYIVLDYRGWLRNWVDGTVVALLIAPTLLGGIEEMLLGPNSQASNWHTVALAQLSCLICRVTVWQALALVSLSALIYSFVTIGASNLPPTQIPTLLLTDLVVAIGVLVFTMRIDLRDRQVFLLHAQDEIRREILAEQNRNLARMTLTDPLTGLGNRRCLDDSIARLWSDGRSRHSDVTLIMFDIDHFKQFNDHHGHQAGDECLAMLARVVTGCMRNGSDVLARYGGEEFALMMSATGIAEGFDVAERVRRGVQDAAIPHSAGPTGCVTVSLGVATVVPAAQTAEALIEMADRCLYDAKRNGRNCVVADGFCPILPDAREGTADDAIVSDQGVVRG
jgi:diguanylate cyclase (GGDEF)-like protein